MTSVHHSRQGDVAVLRLDDGKANAVSHALIGELRASLDRAEKESRAVLLAGRPGRFSAGFDLSEMTKGESAVRDLVGAGAELLLRVFTFPRPVVAACTGHALAAGALLLLSCDLRIGASGSFKIGLNEVAIGMTPPLFMGELARQRISRRFLVRATTLAEIFTPEGAVEAGFLDRVVTADVLEAEALAEAQRLCALPDPAFRNAKLRERGEIARRIREGLADDLRTLAGPIAP